MRLALAFALVLTAACGARPGPGLSDPVRFHNRAPVTVVNDRKDVPETPEEREYLQLLYHLDGHYHRRFTRWTEMHPERRAANTNALDEVPDSTWFTNRIGVRDMSVEEVRRGPNREPGPEAFKPWKIVSSKVGGAAIGFIIEDTKGDRYLLKFDGAGRPEMETGADVILARLLHACGYNVPEDYVVTFEPGELVIGEDAEVRGRYGEARPLTQKYLEARLALVERNPDGSFRALASRFLAGEPLGGWPREGTRPDDPNDVIPHQLRRELRGARPIFAWLAHQDLKEDNTLDMWVEDPADPKVHYVKHYLLDLGNALGVQDYKNADRYLGHAYLIDFVEIIKATAALGLYRRPWEGREKLPYRGVGLYDVEAYDPARWKPFTPSYFPLHHTDRFDSFWGAKIMARFTEPMLRAAVGEAKLSDPAAVEYLVETLIARQRKTVRYWFHRVNPLDRFAVEGQDRLCFDDLALVHRLETVPTRYRARAFDHDGRPLAWSQALPPAAASRRCHSGLSPTLTRDGYLIIELRTDRPGRRLPPTLVHLAPAAGGGLHVIGIRRL
jgi:hypothetical protein